MKLLPPIETLRSKCCDSLVRLNVCPDFLGDDPRTMTVATTYYICWDCGHSCDVRRWSKTRMWWKTIVAWFEWRWFSAHPRSAPEYTQIMHLKRLTKMMEEDEPCRVCPAAAAFGDWNFVGLPRACKVCAETVGIDLSTRKGQNKCPCLVLGKEEALKRTRIVLGL